MLLRVLAAATFVLSLGACVQRDYLVADPADTGVPAGEARYTDNISYVTRYSTDVEIIPLRLDPAFPADERREILRAIGEWNHVLNGYVRFQPTIRAFHAEGQRGDPAPPRANVWSILPARGAMPIGGHVIRPLAVLQPMPHGGGVVMIFRETAVAALATAVRHELGHVLGLSHDPESRLMSPIHDPLVQQCIDKATVAAVARLRGLPLEELNWCQDTAAGG